MASKNSKRMKQAYYWTLLAIVFVGVVIGNIINSYVYKTIDLTDDQRYSLSESTEEFLENSDSTFKSRVFIEIFLDGPLPAELSHFKDAIEDKLKEFKDIAGDRIEYKFTDPKAGSKGDAEEREALLWEEGKGILPMNVLITKDGHESQMRLWPGAVMEYGGAADSRSLKIQLLPGTNTQQPVALEQIGPMLEDALRNLEYNLMNGLRRITREKTPKVAFLQGHGELNFGATYTARSVIGLDYSVQNVEIKDSLHALDGIDGLVIARPMEKFTDKELYILDQFVMRGGRLMCFLDALEMREDSLRKYKEVHAPRIETGLSEQLFDYGISLKDNYVLDANCAPKAVSLEQTAKIPWFYHVLASPTSHPISRNVERVSLKYTSELQLRNNMKGVVVTPILKSSSNSTVTGSAPLVTYAIPLNYLEQGKKVPELALDPTNPANEKCLAAVSEGFFTSSFKNRLPPEFTSAKEINYIEKSSKEGKIFVIGNGRMMMNEYETKLNPTGTEYMYRPKPGLDGRPFNDLMFDRELAYIRYPHIFGNQDFFQNLVDYMMDDNSVLDIRSKQIEIHAIDKVKVQEDAGFYKTINLLLPLIIIIGLAIVMFILRRRKYAS